MGIRLFAFQRKANHFCEIFPIHGAGDCDPASWEVNEEGRKTWFRVWHLSARLLQLEISRTDNSFFSLLVDRDRFIDTLLEAYCEFGKKGGWGRFGDWGEINFEDTELDCNIEIASNWRSIRKTTPI